MARTAIDQLRWALVPVFLAVTAWRLAGARGPQRGEWLSVVLLSLIGMAIAWLRIPGTTVVRTLAVLVALGGLLWTEATVWAALLLVLVAPAAFLLTWELGGRPGATSGQPAPAPAGERRAKRATIGVILAVAGASVAYRLIVAHRLEQTAALFIGVPTFLAVLVVLAGTPRTATGSICKAIAIALLVSGIFLGEGFVCILMAAPLFFAVGVMIGVVVDLSRHRLGDRAKNRTFSLLVLALLPMSLEGVDGRLSWPREETVTVVREVAASTEEVARQLAHPLEFRTPLPAFFRLGFPHPIDASGHGTSPGDQRRIRFGGGEGRPGDLVLEVVESRPGLLRLRAVADQSHIAHWLSWQDAEVRWSPSAGRGSRVSWSLRYRRELDPAWYFGPWERYGVGLAAGYLIDNLAAPPR